MYLNFRLVCAILLLEYCLLKVWLNFLTNFAEK
uniref:Uncharacterized protein n=1 Tax=Arundo donax TaxID=35708 RepID=A0A0A8Y8W5_ARUDO